MANKHAAYDLAQMQSLPLEAKILMAKRRIQEWYDYWDGGVYVSFSGGKDSTVLLHLVRSMYPDVQAVFVNTGLEYPEIQAFAKQHDNVTILRPSMSFNEVLGEYGYPMIGKEVAQRLYYAKRGTASALRDLDAVNSDGTYSKFKASHYGKYKPMVSLPIRFSHKCCLVMKEAPLRTFERQHHMHPIMGTMATESMRRKQAWMAVGCNAFDGAVPSSKPLSVWTEQDILRYLMQFNVPYCSIYGRHKRTPTVSCILPALHAPDVFSADLDATMIKLLLDSNALNTPIQNNTNIASTEGHMAMTAFGNLIQKDWVWDTSLMNLTNYMAKTS